MIDKAQNNRVLVERLNEHMKERDKALSSAVKLADYQTSGAAVRAQAYAAIAAVHQAEISSLRQTHTITNLVIIA